MDHKKYTPNITLIPRTRDPIYVPPEAIEEKIPWKFGISLFAQFNLDSEALLGKCFEFDWNCLRKPRKLKDEDEIKKLKELLRSAYRNLKDVYRNLAAANPTGTTRFEIWSISQNSFQDFVSKTNILANGELETAGLGLAWVATNSGGDKKN